MEQVKKLAQHQCRNAYYDHLSQLFNPHTNTKKFWSFIKEWCKDNTGVPSLFVGGTTVTDDLDKANTLKNQFVWAFIKEDVSNIPGIGGPLYPSMDNIEIDINGVAHLLSNLDPQRLQPRWNPNRVS